MPTSFEAAWSSAAAAEGWLTEAQGRWLFDAAARVPAGEAVVEVGSHHGKSTILLASGLPAGTTLTAIDPFDDPRWGGGPDALAAFESNLERAGVRDRVVLARALSADVAASWSGAPVGLAWIDGAHDLKSVLADLDGWIPRLAPGGLLVLHDAFSAIGTTKAVLRRLWWNRSLRYAGCERTLVAFVREDRTHLEALVDAARLARRLPFFARMVGIKLARRRHWPRIERALMRGEHEPLI